jgi:hypothetical protein
MDWYKFDTTGAVLSGDGKMIKCDVHGDAPTVALDGGFGCRACATEAYLNASECGRLRAERQDLLNALQAVLHGDGVYYELSPTPREFARASVAACAEPEPAKNPSTGCGGDDDRQGD